MPECKCRNCGKTYEEKMSWAEFKGYCNQGCLNDKARELGYKPRSGRTVYQVLKAVKKIGSVYA